MCAVFGGSSWAANASSESDLSVKPGLLKDRPLEDYGHWVHPAAADSRPDTDYIDNYANDVGDALFFTPGVSVNALDLAEPRITIRGYGIGNRQERSTVAVLRDGAPLTDVHGETNTVEIDLFAVDRVDIFRGGGGNLRFTGDNLGGALNFISRTGRTARPGLSARFDGAVFAEGTPGGQGHVDLAGVAGALDYYASFTGRFETGFRDNNQRADAIFNANVGYEFSPTFNTRFYVEAIGSDTELAGGLTPADADDDPSQAMAPITLGPLFPGGPIVEFANGAEDGEFGRRLITGRVANATEFELFGVSFDGGGHFVRREIESPQIDYIGVLDEAGTEWGARLAARQSFRIFNVDTDFRLGGAYTSGSKSSDRFENLGGDKGDALFETDQQSTLLTAFVEAVARPFKKLLVDIGVKFVKAKRELTVDDDVENANFTGIAARGGVLYELTKSVQIFANASRSYEPPSMSELISDNPEDLNGLEEQDTFGYEAGVRGQMNGWLGWDVTYFSTSIENEIINIEEPETNGLGDTLFNVPTSSHSGVEAGVDVSLFPRRFAGSGGALTLRNAYTYSDFSFKDSGSLNVDGNQLAGAPRHLYRGELRYTADDRWFAGVNVQHAAGSYFADHENTVSIPTYTLVGFSAGYQLNDNVEIYASGENLTDQRYAAGITPVLSQTDQTGRIFTPGPRASLYGGFRYRF